MMRMMIKVLALKAICNHNFEGEEKEKLRLKTDGFILDFAFNFRGNKATERRYFLLESFEFFLEDVFSCTVAMKN